MNRTFRIYPTILGIALLICCATIAQDVKYNFMLAPGAMGTSSQVDSDKTTEGQAQNRRVVVRILQNKGVAGT